MSEHLVTLSPAERYAKSVVRWRWLVLPASLAFVIAAATGVRHLTFIDEYRVFFGPDNPQLLAFDEVENIYTKNDNIFFIIEPPSHHDDAFTTETLTVVENITEEAWRIPFAIRVDSLATFQHSWAEGDELIVESLVVDSADKTPAELATIRNIALNEPMLRDRLVPPTTDVLGLSVTLQLPRLATDETARAAAHARQIAADIERTHAGYRVRLTGMAMLNNAFQDSAMRDMATLIPLMGVVIVLTLVVLLRSLAATASTLMLVLMSALGALGLAGWTGLSLTPPSTASITMIMTLAVADSIHILVTMLKEMRHGRGKSDAIVESLRINAQPVFLTSLTTIVGLLSMNFSEVPPLNDLGNISAAGVALAWLLSMTFLPALIATLPVKVRVTSSNATSLMDRLADFVIDRRRPLLWGASAVAIALMSMVPLNTLNDQFVNYFDTSTTFRQDSDFAAERLSGLYQIDFSLSSGNSGGINEPGYLDTVDRFANWYRQQSGVVHVASISDIFRRLNKNMNGDDPEQYRLPTERDLAAQYLLVYEMSLPYGLDLNNQINIDKSATRFSVTLENLTSRELIALVEAGETWLEHNAPSAMATRGAGPAVMFSYISDRNIRSMLIGTLVAIGLIGVTMMLMLRSIRYGAISFVPNLLPALMALGLWGFLVGEINLGLSIVTGMCLGIIVDDTVHFLSKYLRARREQQLDAENAVRYAFSTVGAALVVTSIVLVSGFLILAQSTFGFNAGMAQLTSLVIVLALVADLLLLPPLLLFLDRKTVTLSA